MYYKFLKNILKKNKKLFYLAKKYPMRLYRNSYLKVYPFPKEIWLENTNHCNASCIMCPRELQSRPKGIMKLELYKKLVDEISLHKKDIKRLHMHNFGEPLLDKKLPERIKYAKDKGIKHVYFVSNASLLNEENTKKLIESGLDEFKISFYGIDKESYNSTMVDLDYDTTLSNVKNFFQIRNKLKAKNPSVTIQLIPQLLKEGQIEKWYEQFENLLDKSIGDRIIEVPIHNFSDGRDYFNIYEKKITNTCEYPWRTMVVLQDGQVTSCSHDYNGSINLGNVKDNNILEIWNSKKYKKMRSDFKKLKYDDYSVCNKCDIPYV